MLAGVKLEGRWKNNKISSQLNVLVKLNQIILMKKSIRLIISIVNRTLYMQLKLVDIFIPHI